MPVMARFMGSEGSAGFLKAESSGGFVTCIASGSSLGMPLPASKFLSSALSRSYSSCLSHGAFAAAEAFDFDDLELGAGDLNLDDDF